MGAARDVLEPGYGLYDLLGAGCVDLYAGGGGDSVPVWFLRGKVYGGDGGVFLDEHGALKLAPVARLGTALCPVRTGRSLHDQRLVLHAAPKKDSAAENTP